MRRDYHASTSRILDQPGWSDFDNWTVAKLFIVWVVPGIIG